MIDDADLYVIKADAARKQIMGRTHMAIRTTAVIDIGGEELLSDEDKNVFSQYPDDQKHIHTSTVEIAAILAAIEAMPQPAES